MIIGAAVLAILAVIFVAGITMQPLSTTGIHSSSIGQAKKDFFKAQLLYDKATSDAIKDSGSPLDMTQNFLEEYYSSVETELKQNGINCSYEIIDFRKPVGSVEVAVEIICITQIGSELKTTYWETVDYQKTYEIIEDTDTGGESEIVIEDGDSELPESGDYGNPPPGRGFEGGASSGA